MKIDKNTTLKIAKLSRIGIEDSEIDEFSKQLDAILNWVDLLNEVDTDKVEPLNNVSMSSLNLRKDIDIISDNSKSILSNAPEKLENYFVVPKVVD